MMAASSEQANIEDRGNVTDVEITAQVRKTQRWSPSGSVWRDFLHFCGPGWIVAIAYIDPGNYQADIQAGATSGYNLLWTVLWATLLSIFVQMLCARLAVMGQVTLAEVQRENFPRHFRYMCWIIAEFSVIITDLPEVIGIGIAFNVLFGWPYYAGVLLSPFSTMIFLASQEVGGMRYLECIIVFFIGVMSIALWIEMGLIGADAKQVVQGIVYGFAKPNGLDIFSILGVLGAVVMPHNLYIHTATVMSRPVKRTGDVVKKAIFWAGVEPVIPILVSFFINMAVVSIAAVKVYGTENAELVGNTDFDTYLTIAGGRTLWGIALLAAGQSSAITTTYAGQHIMEGFLQIRLPVWQRAIFTRFVALIPCVIVAAVAEDEALNVMVNFVNAAESILLPFALTPLIKFSTSELYLGKENTPGKLQVFILWFGAFAAYAVNAFALSADGGGFFGTIMRGEMVQVFAEQNLTITIQTFKTIQINIINDVLQVAYLAWNIYVIVSPIRKPMRPITDIRNVEEEACFGVVFLIGKASGDDGESHIPDAYIVPETSIGSLRVL